MRTIVVGAGITGLICADALRMRGHEVIVLEAGARVGGRMRTVTVGGCNVEIGANFLSSSYRVLPRLARSIGVSLRPIRARAGIVVDSRAVTYAANPVSMMRSGALGVSDIARTGRGLMRIGPRVLRGSTTDPAAWTDLDEPAGPWLRQRFGEAFADRVAGSAFRGYYFQDIERASAGAALAVLAHASRPMTALTADPGLETIPATLAARLDVRLNHQVIRVDRDQDGAGVVLSDATSIEADRVVIATPASSAALVLPDTASVEKELLATPYSSGLLVVLTVDRRLRDDELAGAYGLLVAPGSGGEVAAMCVASRAGHADDRDAVTVMFDGDAAERSMNEGVADSELIRRARDAVIALAPSLADDIDEGASRVIRLPVAMPTCEPGRARLVRRYRDQQVGPVVLAGDFLSFPWTDSAAWTGLWAAWRACGVGSRDSDTAPRRGRRTLR